MHAIENAFEGNSIYIIRNDDNNNNNTYTIKQISFSALIEVSIYLSDSQDEVETKCKGH